MNPAVRLARQAGPQPRAHEWAARARKADGLMAVIARLPAAEQTVAAVSAWGDEQWRLAAAVANVRLPSETTRATVLERLRRHEAINEYDVDGAGSLRVVSAVCRLEVSP